MQSWRGTLCFIWPLPWSEFWYWNGFICIFVQLFHRSETNSRQDAQIKVRIRKRTSRTATPATPAPATLNPYLRKLNTRSGGGQLWTSCPPRWRWFVLASVLIPTICAETCQAFLRRSTCVERQHAPCVTWLLICRLIEGNLPSCTFSIPDSKTSTPERLNETHCGPSQTSGPFDQTQNDRFTCPPHFKFNLNHIYIYIWSYSVNQFKWINSMNQFNDYITQKCFWNTWMFFMY